jgi:hypothetical protein
MDPSAYGKRSQVIEGPTIAEVFERAGVRLQLADNSRLHGWMQIRQRLRNNQLKIFKTCHNLRRTIPLLQHDKKHLEDAAEGGEDHAPDTLRYLCMARPYVKREPVKAKPIKGFSHYNYNDLHKAIEAQHNE